MTLHVKNGRPVLLPNKGDEANRRMEFLRTLIAEEVVRNTPELAPFFTEKAFARIAPALDREFGKTLNNSIASWGEQASVGEMRHGVRSFYAENSGQLFQTIARLSI